MRKLPYVPVRLTFQFPPEVSRKLGTIAAGVRANTGAFVGKVGVLIHLATKANVKDVIAEMSEARDGK